MFSLRIIEETRDNEKAPFEQVISNYSLGSSYSLLRSGITKEFDEIMKSDYPEYDKKIVSAIVMGDNGTTMFVMKNETNKQYSYFIMTENGKTFERL